MCYDIAMKKSFLLFLSLPLLLASCAGSSQPKDEEIPEQQTTTETGQESGTQTGQGTEGSGTGTTTGGDSGSGGGGGSGQGTSGDEGGSGSGQGTSGGEGSGSGGQSQTTSITVEKNVSELGLSNSSKPTTININNDISITCDVGTNANKNAPAYYESDLSLRFYPNNTLKFTNSKGVIDKIELSVNGNSFSSSSGQMDNNTWTGSASEVTLTAGGTKNNAKLFSFVITYKTSGGGTSSGGGSNTGGETTGGGTETGGSTTGGGGTVSTTDYTSTWPTDCQKYIKTYVNGMVPCYLNVNKNCLFNTYSTSSLNNGCIPVYTAQVKNTSPDINYIYDYGGILRDANFTFNGTENDEDGDTWYYYSKGLCQVMYSKYRSDGIYYFDVRMYYEYYNDNVAPNAYTIQYDDKTFALTNRYESNNKTVSVNGWSIKLNDIQKQGEEMQLKKDTGKITITGSIKSVYVEVIRNGDALFVKAGTNASNANYIFNNGGLFEFPSGTTYVEIGAVSRVLEFEFLELAK